MTPRTRAANGRAFAALFILASSSAAASGCGGAPAKSIPPPLPPLHLQSVAALAPAASLIWIVDAKPRAFFGHPEMVIAVRVLFPDAKFETFTRRHGGIDLRQLDELTVASYPGATLFLGHGLIDPHEVESAFTARATVDGRAIDRQSTDPLGTIVRMWGTMTSTSEREQIAVFGREAIGLESGRFGPLRAAELFAQGRLKKASPAFEAPPLARTREVLGAGELRAFAPGPFEGEWSHALGGLLAASTAIAISATFAQGDEEGARLALRIVVMGGWKDDAPAAATRLVAAIDTLASSAIGRLCGFDKPTAGPTVRAGDDALVADLTVRALPVFRGLKAATGASIDEVMSY
jgi:hypothetical protein